MQNSVESHTLAEQVGSLLRARKLSLCLAESCTGGLVGDLITDTPGSSDYFLGGVTAYSNSAKQDLLGVQAETLARFGAVSAQCAAEMAQGVRRLFKADLAVSVTGIAGPGGGSEEKPVGLTYLHLSAPDAEIGLREMWSGDRRANKESAALAALRLLARYLQEAG